MTRSDWQIRCFESADISFALQQTQREGWDSTAESFHLCLEHDPESCFVAESDGRRVGMVTTTRYRGTGWIGNLIVTPSHRIRGIGRALMLTGLESLSRKSVSTVRLEADPAGIELYRSFGFVDEFESLRFRAPALRERGPTNLRRISRSDLPALTAFDGHRFGDDHGRLLGLLHSSARATYLMKSHGRIVGYALVVPARQGVKLGPCLAVDSEVARQLLASVLAEFSEGLIILGAPASNPNVEALMESAGFQRTTSSYRMVLGERRCAGRPEEVYAIANGAMG